MLRGWRGRRRGRILTDLDRTDFGDGPVVTLRVYHHPLVSARELSGGVTNSNSGLKFHV